MTGHYHKLRRVTSGLLLALLIGIPFLRINGESAFRFDIPTLRLLFFGSEIWLADSFLILIAIIFLTFLTLFVTTLFGRIWCGWLCPQTVFMDSVGLMKDPTGGTAVRIAGEAGAAAASGVIAFSLIAYFVAPREMPALLSARGTAATVIEVSWISLTALLYLNSRLLGRKFCATVCPYAKMQGVLFDRSTLQIAYDPNRDAECMGCEACVRSCPVHIDVRKGLQIACIHCAECADACTSRMKKRGKESLIGYFWGAPGTNVRALRINPLITGMLTGLSLVFLIYLAATRMPFDMTVRLMYAGPGSPIKGTAYDLSFRNMTAKDLPVELSATAAQGTAVIEPRSVLVRKGSDLTRITASVMLDPAFGQTSVPLTLTARSLTDNRSVSKKVYVPIFESK